MYSTIDQIRAANAAAGDTFFSPSTMREHRRRVLKEVVGGTYFVTSEPGPSGVRRYTLRYTSEDGEVTLVSVHATAAAALRTARRISTPAPRKRLFGLGSTR